MKKRWIILGISCLINLCIGSIYAWSVFSLPMSDYLGSILGTPLSPGDLSIVFTVSNAVGPITLISGGFINDKIGPKWVIFVGGLMFAVGMIGSGFVSSISMLIVSYGIFCGLGMGLVYGCTVSNAVKFFPDKRGLAGGITTASYGISSAIVPYLANALINKFDVLFTFKFIGTVFGIIICAGALFMRQCPDGFSPTNNNVSSKVTNKNIGAVQKSPSEMLRDPIFYIMILLLTCGAVCGLMVISQTSPLAQIITGMSVASATVVVSVLALFNAAGRVMAGIISDMIGRINTLTVMLGLSLAGLLLLYTSSEGTYAKFYIGVSIVGLCFGSFMGVFPGFTADRFGEKNNSVNYGIMFVGFSLAGYLGPAIMNMLYVRYETYKYAFVFAAALSVFGVALTMVYRLIGKKKS